MKILVTGSEGSLAQIVIPYLQKDGHEIIGVDNFARYGHIERERNYEFITGDLGDTAVVKSIFAGHTFDAVFHFAALIFENSQINNFFGKISGIFDIVFFCHP